MHKSKVIQLLKTFSKEEIKEFRDYVNSPLYNRNKAVMKLYEIARKKYPDFTSSFLEKQNLFAKLYPGKPYNDVVMRILISDLLKLAEEYLGFIRFKADHFTSKKFILGELKKRKQDSLFIKTLKEMQESLNKDSMINNDYFLNLQDMQSIKIDYLISRDEQTKISDDVQKQGGYLIFYAMNMLFNIAHEMKIQEEVLNVDYGINFVQKFLESLDIDTFYKYAEENSNKYSEISLIYYYMYKAYITSDENDEYYFKLKSAVENNFNRFDREEKFNLLIILESICNNKLSRGHSVFYRHLMDIYELMLSHSILGHSEESYIQINLFRNIFFTAVVLKKFDWAEKFVKAYTNRLIPEHRENMIRYSKALLYFENQKYEEALAEITKVNYEFFVFKLDVRVLLLKLYFELNSFEQAYSLIDSFSHFLSNNKDLLSRDKHRFDNFLKYFRQLLKCCNDKNTESAFFLKKNINEDAAVIGRRWLLEKVSVLI
jgi:hypothetical protein